MSKTTRALAIEIGGLIIKADRAECPTKDQEYCDAAEQLLISALREAEVRGLEQAMSIARSYFEEKVCGDECLTRTTASDIYHDIKLLAKKSR